MIRCQKCGQVNSNTSNFCRSCGANFSRLQRTQQMQNTPPPQFQEQQERPIEPENRRPYSWKTDELEIKKNSRSRKTQKIDQVQPIPQPFQPANQQAFQQMQPQPQHLAHQQQSMTHGYRCPRCQTNAMPIISRQISTAGWITFGVLLVFTLIFFWIGLLIKEDVRVCPVCNLKVG